MIHSASAWSLIEGTSRIGFEQLILKAGFSERERRLIMQAYRLSKTGHQHQKRDGGGRYFDHPKAVAILLVRLGVRDVFVIVEALLHDMIEDSFVLELSDLEDWFGADVRLDVAALTKSTPQVQSEAKSSHEQLTAEEKHAAKAKKHAEYIAKLLSAGPRVWLVKLGDRTHNMLTLADSDDPSKRERYRRKKLNQVEETRTDILQLARKLAATPPDSSAELAGSWRPVKLAESTSYVDLGQWFLRELMALCDRREQEPP